MKTYILPEPNSVQPQKAQFAEAVPTLQSQSAAPLQPTPAAARPPTLFIGLDVHSESIAVSLAPSDSTEVRRYGLIGGTHDDVLRLAKKLAAAHPGRRLEFCYEAGPHGYPLCRFLRGHRLECRIAAPSKIPRAPGQRVKTNRRGADQLARLSRAGELMAIAVPEVLGASGPRPRGFAAALPAPGPGFAARSQRPQHRQTPKQFTRKSSPKKKRPGDLTGPALRSAWA